MRKPVRAASSKEVSNDAGGRGGPISGSRRLQQMTRLSEVAWDPGNQDSIDLKTEMFLQAASCERVPRTSYPGQGQRSVIPELHVWHAGTSAFRHEHAPVDGGGRGHAESCAAGNAAPRALLPLAQASPLQCLCAIAETSGLVSVTPHSALPFSRPGFHLSSQNYQYLSCYIFYYLFTVNSLFRSLIAACETSQSGSKYPETKGKVRERKEHTHKGNKEHANPLSSAWAKHLTWTLFLRTRARRPGVSKSYASHPWASWGPVLQTARATEMSGDTLTTLPLTLIMEHSRITWL